MSRRSRRITSAEPKRRHLDRHADRHRDRAAPRSRQLTDHASRPISTVPGNSAMGRSGPVRRPPSRPPPSGRTRAAEGLGGRAAAAPAPRRPSAQSTATGTGADAPPGERDRPGAGSASPRQMPAGAVGVNPIDLRSDARTASPAASAASVHRIRLMASTLDRPAPAQTSSQRSRRFINAGDDSRPAARLHAERMTTLEWHPDRQPRRAIIAAITGPCCSWSRSLSPPTARASLTATAAQIQAYAQSRGQRAAGRRARPQWSRSRRCWLHGRAHPRRPAPPRRARCSRTCSPARATCSSASLFLTSVAGACRPCCRTWPAATRPAARRRADRLAGHRRLHPPGSATSRWSSSPC